MSKADDLEAELAEAHADRLEAAGKIVRLERELREAEAESEAGSGRCTDCGDVSSQHREGSYYTCRGCGKNSYAIDTWLRWSKSSQATGLYFVVEPNGGHVIAMWLADAGSACDDEWVMGPVWRVRPAAPK
jgi:hypothetical protein